MRKQAIVRILAAAFALCLATAATAANFNVNSTADLPDLAPGDGNCAAAGNVCTFRAAVQETNALPGRDHISVPNGTYAGASEIVITGRVGISGNGLATELTMPIQVGTSAVRANVFVRMESLKLTSVKVAGLLTLDSVTVTTLATGAELFGPLRDPNPGIRVYNSTVTNVAVEEALLVLQDSLMNGGQLTLTNAAAYINRSSIVESPISAVHTTTASRSDITAVNSTFSGAATQIQMADPRDTIDLTYCTVAAGAGIPPAGVLAATNSIIQRPGPLCDPCGENNHFSADPMLGPLTLVNGKLVHPPLPGSPAINTGNAPNRYDERSVGRPSGPAPDRGAFEVCGGPCPGLGPTAQGDFNLDARGDVLWRRESTGELAVWLMDGTTVLNGHFLPDTIGRPYHAVGDFDGDGDADLLLEGQEPVMLMNGVVSRPRGTQFSSPFVPLPPDYQNVVGYGDLNGDGLTDVVSRGGGQLHLQMMYGTFALTRSIAAPSNDWSLAAVRDFSGDGRADLIWKSTVGNAVAVWQMDDFELLNGYYNANPGSNLALLAIGDFTGDGRGDVLYRNSNNSTIVVWETDTNGVFIGSTIIASTMAPWLPRAVTRMDDGPTDDLFWRNDTTGSNAVWTLSPGGTVLSAAYVVAVPDPDWVVVGPR